MWFRLSVSSNLFVLSQQLSQCPVTSPPQRIMGHHSQKSMLACKMWPDVAGHPGIFGIQHFLFYCTGTPQILGVRLCCDEWYESMGIGPQLQYGLCCSSSPHLPTSSPAHHYAPSPFIHHLPTDGVKLLLHHPHPLEHPLHYLSISLLVASMINLLHTCCLFTPYVFSTYQSVCHCRLCFCLLWILPVSLCCTVWILTGACLPVWSFSWHSCTFAWLGSILVLTFGTDCTSLYLPNQVSLCFCITSSLWSCWASLICDKMTRSFTRALSQYRLGVEINGFWVKYLIQQHSLIKYKWTCIIWQLSFVKKLCKKFLWFYTNKVEYLNTEAVVGNSPMINQE